MRGKIEKLSRHVAIWSRARFSLTCCAAPRLRVCRDDSRVSQATEVKAIAVVVILWVNKNERTLKKIVENLFVKA